MVNKVILVHAIKAYRWNRGTAPQIPSLGTTQKWSTSRHGRFIPGKQPLYPSNREAGWAPEPVGSFWGREKYLAPAGIVQPAAYCHTDYDTQAHPVYSFSHKYMKQVNLLLTRSINSAYRKHYFHRNCKVKNRWKSYYGDKWHVTGHR
jgi:hypothetical protein